MATTRGKTKEAERNSQAETVESEEYDTKAELKDKENLIKTTLKKLLYFNKTTRETLITGKTDQIERQHGLLKVKVNEVYDLIDEMQELFIEMDEDDDVIDNWTAETKGSLHPFADSVYELESHMKAEEAQKQEKQRKEKLDYEAELRKRLQQEEIKVEHEKQARKEKFALELEEKRLKMAEKTQIKTNLPDLHITKFQGTHIDWVRYWSLFETQIDQTPMREESKFSYLKELVVPKVRSTIEKLPPNSEGYKRAKDMLKERYGDTSEVVNAHIQQIMALPVIHGPSRPKIHDFYDQLLGHVQALDTLSRLHEVTGNVRMTLDKLDGIRPDLTGLDPKWKEWSFHDFIEALHGWIERNPLQYGERQAKPFSREFKSEKTFTTREPAAKQRQCFYCEQSDHKAVDCPSVSTVEDRRKTLSSKKLCFNCGG